MNSILRPPACHPLRAAAAAAAPRAGLLASQRREREEARLPFTKALWSLLTAIEATGDERVVSSCSEPAYLVLQGMHLNLCTPFDRNSSAVLRNHNEELRCV